MVPCLCSFSQPVAYCCAQRGADVLLSIHLQYLALLHAHPLQQACLNRLLELAVNSACAANLCRDSASSLLHRAAHYIHAQRVASELESQAASWQLLQHLYCSGHHPAGDTMPGAADAGGLQTYREQAAGLVNESTDLRRCGQLPSVST